MQKEPHDFENKWFDASSWGRTDVKIANSLLQGSYCDIAPLETCSQAAPEVSPLVLNHILVPDHG